MKKKKTEKPLTRAKAKIRIQKKKPNAELIALKRQLRIEAALDRVRKKALAMKKPDDLLKICKTLYNELQLLGFDELRNSMINIHNDDNESFLNYDYAKAGPSITHFTYHTHPVIEDLVRRMKSGRTAFSEQVLSGKRLKEFNAFRKRHGEKTDAKLRDAKALYYYFYSTETGALGISSLAPLDPDQLKILKRFKNVFDLAYRRYADIQKAEAQARESQIEAALEKVRSRSLAMHRSDELREVVKAVFDKLQELNFVLEDGAVSILIFKENSRGHTQWIADPGHSYATPFELAYSDHSIPRDVFAARESGADYFSKIYPTEEKNEYFKFLFTHTSYKYLPDDVKELILRSVQYGFSIALAKNSAIIVPTSSGRLLTESEKEILKRFVNVFEQSYTRFLDLQKAEAQAREAQIEAALERVRSSAMAMRVSEELNIIIAKVFRECVQLDMQLDRGVIMIFDPETLDARWWMANPEYLRLSYHGLRAKDKTFNAKFETNFDPGVGKVNLIPQDMGRVILNLINNAFYAVAEKEKKLASENYEPTVSVTTTKSNGRPDDSVGRGKIQIIIKDNGNGIPESVKDKIFQPFFTTKPAGQGTGLGLSLSYDIVKAHGGEIKVATIQGGGTDFIIHLPDGKGF